MTCPKCGLQILADQKYCRSCGAPLQLNTQRLVEPETVTDIARTSAIAAADGKHSEHNFLLWGFITMLVGAAIGVVGKKLLYEDVITVIGVLVSLVGMFLVVYPYLVPARRKNDDSRFSSQPEILTPSQPTRRLPQASRSEFVPSITEATTDLLKDPVARRRGPNENQHFET